jgi:hypothetical protein
MKDRADRYSKSETGRDTDREIGKRVYHTVSIRDWQILGF